MEKFNAVIVGCGAIAPIHAEAIKQSEYAELYGVCDIDESKLNEYNVKKFTSFDEVLRDTDVDAIHICTPHYLHPDMIVKGINSGKSLVVEKPIAITIDALSRLDTLCREPNCKILTVLQNRYNSCIVKMKEIVSGFDLGRLLGLKGNVCWLRDANYYQTSDWRGKWETEGGGLVINQAIHMLDMLNYLGGGAVAIKGSIDTRALNDAIEVEDTAEATLYFPGNVRGHFFATNAYSCNEPFEITLTFESGIVRYMDGKLFDENFNVITVDQSSDGGKSYWGDSHKVVIDNFYSSLAGNAKPYPTIFDGIRATELALGLYESAKINDKYEIKF